LGARLPSAQFRYVAALKIHFVLLIRLWLIKEQQPMLMYSKEANNRKQEIDRQHHTIPNQRNQRPKDKHCGKIQKFRFFHNADYYEIPPIFHIFL
jgi:hypothetical protein